MTGAAGAYGGCVIQLARSLILPASTSCRSRSTFSHFCDRPVREATDSLSEMAANPRRHTSPLRTTIPAPSDAGSFSSFSEASAMTLGFGAMTTFTRPAFPEAHSSRRSGNHRDRRDARRAVRAWAPIVPGSWMMARLSRRATGRPRSAGGVRSCGPKLSVRRPCSSTNKSQQPNARSLGTADHRSIDAHSIWCKLRLLMCEPLYSWPKSKVRRVTIV
jgi:hypothetical protein